MSMSQCPAIYINLAIIYVRGNFRPVVTMTVEDVRALRILERICGPVKDRELDTNNHEENILISL